MVSQRRLLFVTLSNIGDLVMTTPLLEALHNSYPDHLIDIVADTRSSDLLKPCPYLGRLIHKEKSAGIIGSLNLVKQLREQTYDIAIDLRSVVLTLFIRCAERGFKRRGTSLGDHAVQHHFTALRSVIGADVTIPLTKLWLDEAAQKKARELLAGLGDGRRLIVAPGANWPGKIWPIEYFATVIDELGAQFDGVVVVGSKDDRALGDRLVDDQHLPMINLAGETSLLEVAACMSGASAFLGNDSGLGHIAAAMGVPTVTVFGPGRPARYRPWGPRSERVLAPNEDLSELQPALVAEVMTSHLAKPSRGV